MLLELFESQMTSRHLDLIARKLRARDAAFYTIGSSGHEGNAVLGRLTRHTDPAFLHYRSGALMVERSRHVAGIDPVRQFPHGYFLNSGSYLFLPRLDNSRLRHIVAAHLSRKNNQPELAVRALSAALNCEEGWVAVATQDSGLDWRELS